MTGFLNVKKFEFNKKSLEQAYSFLKAAGKESFEAVALFAGSIEGGHAIIKEAILPLQKSYKLESGLMYAVDGKELHRINVWLYENKMSLLAQIHSHPKEAYHSETDDEFPIVATIGGLSIVVPNFAKGNLNHMNWAYYRLSVDAEWSELSESDIDNLIEIK
jgi:hypothetical protein